MLARLCFARHPQPKSFEAVKKWKQDLDSNVAALSGATGSFVLPAVLLANKADLLIRADGSAGDPEVARTTEVSELIESMKFTKWFATSAKSGANVRDATTARECDSRPRFARLWPWCQLPCTAVL